MATLYNQKDKNIRLTWVYITFFLTFVIGVAYVFAGALGSRGILYGAVGISVFMSISSYWFSDRIVLKMSSAHPLDKNTHREIYRLVENLAITVGCHCQKSTSWKILRQLLLLWS